MPASTTSPLAMLVHSGLEALGACDVDPAMRRNWRPSESVQQIAGGLLVAMGYKEIADDLDLEAIALLGAASVAGLQLFAQLEPGMHRVDQALYALEDLLRRSAPGGNQS